MPALEEGPAGTGVTYMEVPVTNTGSISAQSGTLYFGYATGAAIAVNGDGSIDCQPDATIDIAGNLLGSTQNAVRLRSSRNRPLRRAPPTPWLRNCSKR